MTTVFKKHFQYFHKIKLVDLLTMMTCNNDNLKIFETHLVDLLTKLTYKDEKVKNSWDRTC